ncbi:MAG: metalloregulator ArsR/SmtB family transcription factor [Gammaproteobacteria bacterium]|nr:metalloregulator ArsR/SmtB family transcription factor [Gammaproteobacteria bacterium]
MLSSAYKTNAESQEYLDLVFKALGDQTRREILARLSEGPAMVTELAQPFDMSLPAVGKHVRVLENAGLVEREITGRLHRCTLNPLPLKNAEDWLVHYKKFWDETFDALGDYFQRENE